MSTRFRTFLNILLILSLQLSALVNSVDFPAKFQNWETTDPKDLFQAPIVKSEANPKVTMLCNQYWLS